MGQFSFRAVVVMGMLFFHIPWVHADATATTEEYLQSGNDSFNQGDFDQAIFDYTKALDINPNLS